MKLNNHIEKLCCFYASDWHLTVMLLPYINSKIEENNSIYMKCENNIEEKMETLLDKLFIKNKELIKNIYWNEIIEEEYDDKGKIFIVSGNDEYIKNKNNLIEQYYKNKTIKVKIINCYELSENNNLNDIIQKNGYTQILNTKGENTIENIN